MYVKSIDARIIKDSRKEDTIEVSVQTGDGLFRASAPSGKSKGKYEARAFSSKGFDFSIGFAKALGKRLREGNIALTEFYDLRKVEGYARGIDKTTNWALIGANALYAVESALLKAIAASHEMELWKFLCAKPKVLPMPLGNCIGGGVHVKQETKTDFQEFLLLPKTQHFFDAYFINLQAYKIAKKFLLEKDKRYEGMLTDEQAFASTMGNEDVLWLLLNVKKEIKDRFNIDLRLGLDVASSTFFRGNYYYQNPERKLNREQQISYILELIKKYSLHYVEDALHEEDFQGFARLLKEVQKQKLNCLICGDDLTATQFGRVEKAIKEKSINALIIKPNQNGSLLETERIVDFAREHDITPVISHRSGETSDDTIAHLAVGWQVPIIKTGILGKERFAKLHEILRIEREINKK